MATIDELARQNAMYIEGAKAKAKSEPVAVEPTPVAPAPVAPDLSGQIGYGEQMGNVGNAVKNSLMNARILPGIPSVNALKSVDPINAIKTLVSAPGYGMSADPPAPKINPVVAPGVSPTGGITGITQPNAIASLAATPPPQAGAIQAQATQAATAPAAAPTPIQKLGVRHQPLNVPLQGAQPAQQPAQQGIAPAVGQDLPESPIAYVGYGGNNSTQVAYKDGRTAEIMQGQAMPDDVKAFNLISQQAGQQGGNVNVMRGMPETYNKDGTTRSAGGVRQTLALPTKPGEAFMREVPVELGGNIAAIGKYQAAQSQGAINNADPTTATNVQRDKELAATLANAQSVANINKDSHLGGAGISAGASKYNADVGAKSAMDVETSRASSKTEKSETGKWQVIPGELGGKPEYRMNTATGEIQSMTPASAATIQEGAISTVGGKKAKYKNGKWVPL